MHLVAAGLDVIGVTIPGAPFVVIGHNDRIAWGVTNTGADVQDLYVERLDLTERRYFYRGQWLPLEITAADIPVRGRSPEAVRDLAHAARDGVCGGRPRLGRASGLARRVAAIARASDRPSRCDGTSRAKRRAHSTRSIAPETGQNSSPRSSGSAPRRKISSTPMWTATSATRCPAISRFARTRMGRCRSMDRPGKASGAVTSIRPRFRAVSTPRPASSRRRTTRSIGASPA